MPPKLKSATDLEKWEEEKGFKGVITHDDVTVKKNAAAQAFDAIKAAAKKKRKAATEAERNA